VGGAWGYSWIGSQVEEPSEPAGSGGFLYDYGLYLRRAAKKRRRQKELEEEARALKDKVDREIAELLRLQEVEDEKRDNLARLQRLVQKHSKDALELSDRAKIAYVRALTQANFSALEALDRELQRMIEEEEITALMILLNED
jgi:TolA-binding protein